MSLDPLQRLKRLWQHRWGQRAMLFALPALLLLAADRLFPLPLPQAEFATLVVAEDGTPLRAFADQDGVWRYQTTLDQVSPRYLEALLNYEDRWFYWHPGVNPFAMVRALISNLTAGRLVSGGSTLTMQVARIIEPHSRTIPGKIRQILRALQLEWHLSKQQILTLYLNHAPFGGNIEGVQTASFSYLGKSADRLSDAEAALLAVLPQAPSDCGRIGIHNLPNRRATKYWTDYWILISGLNNKWRMPARNRSQP